MKKNNILFLDIPNISLFGKRFYNDLNAGGILVAGGLEAFGHNVDHYDLNAKLNKYRQEIDNFELSDDDFNILSVLLCSFPLGGVVTWGPSSRTVVTSSLVVARRRTPSLVVVTVTSSHRHVSSSTDHDSL